MSPTKRPQPAPLRLANAHRSLRAKARAYSRAMYKAAQEATVYHEGLAEERERELDEAALKYAFAMYLCNGSSWNGLA